MKIYFSRSKGVDDTVMCHQIHLLIQTAGLAGKVEVVKHEHGTYYDPVSMHEADFVIVGQDRSNFDEERGGPVIGKGCYTEIENALEMDKPVFLLQHERLQCTKKEALDFFIQVLQDEDLDEVGYDQTHQCYGELSTYHSKDDPDKTAYISKDPKELRAFLSQHGPGSLVALLNANPLKETVSKLPVVVADVSNGGRKKRFLLLRKLYGR